MSRRSGRLTLQQKDENTEVPKVKHFRRKPGKSGKKRAELPKKKHSYEIQNLWSEGGVGPCVLLETPYKEVESTNNLSAFKHFRFKNLFVKPSPLPRVSWASSDDVWIKMLNKELKYVHDNSFMERHPSLQPNMRSILLDWLMEVSEVYTLHRETFYLAQDFFDRFMLTQKDVQKTRLQLIGITCLFIASKIEVKQLLMALIFGLFQDLNWDLSPETVISWLKLYIQVASLKDDHNLLLPQFSQEIFLRMTQLLDLCILDINSLKFQYGVLAAAAFCHLTSFEDVQKVSGLTWDNMADCVAWMVPFVRTVQQCAEIQLKDFRKVSPEDRHNIQTHTDYLAMLSDAHLKQQENEGHLSPLPAGGILTPPKSTEKTATH
ncbi:G1/S-specific cyclin-E2-like [Arapaima gigas]